MNVVVPVEFERYAREQVEAGTVASEEEAASQALRQFARYVDEIRRLIDPAMAEADRGEAVDGDQFMDELLLETRSESGE